METVLERWARRPEGAPLLCVTGVCPTDQVGRSANAPFISFSRKILLPHLLGGINQTKWRPLRLTFSSYAPFKDKAYLAISVHTFRG